MKQKSSFKESEAYFKFYRFFLMAWRTILSSFLISSFAYFKTSDFWFKASMKIYESLFNLSSTYW